MPAIRTHGAHSRGPAIGLYDGESSSSTAAGRPPERVARTAVRGVFVVVGIGLALLMTADPASSRTRRTVDTPAAVRSTLLTFSHLTARGTRREPAARTGVPATPAATGRARVDEAEAPADDDGPQVIRGVEQVLRALFAATAFSAVGALVFVRTVWDGSGREFAMLCRLVQWTALVATGIVIAQIGVRAALEAGGLAGAAHALPSVLATSFGIGMVLRATGAALLSAGAVLLRREPTSARPATIGAVLIVGSFAMAGYAAGAGPWFVTAFAIVAHVAAAAAWGGGLLALVVILRHRTRTGRPLRAGYVAARFSVVATYGVALAAIAGIVLASIRLESVSALWATSYGVTLVVKIGLVAVVAGIGAYNHYVVVPVLRVAPDHAIGRRLRWLGYAEVALFVAVIVVNSSLVGLAR